jgi:hypothetical protein
VHELAWAGEDLWVVNTRFSCLCTLHPNYSFVPRWRPPFVTALAAEDPVCHRTGRDRRRRWLAGQQAAGRLPDGRR